MSTAARGLDVQHAPDALGRFGRFGGRFVPETVMAALDELEAALATALVDPAFEAELAGAGPRLRRPPDAALPRRAAHAPRSAARASGSSARTSRTPARTRSTTPSARRCSRGGSASSASWPRRAPASTAWRARPCARASASSASSTWARRTRGARRPTSRACTCWAPTVVPVTSGTATLKEAMNEAIRDWIANVETTHYLIGSAAGPHPYPTLVRELQSVIGREARAQMLGAGGAAAGRRGGLRRRRLERDRHVPRVPRRPRAPDRRGGGRRRRRPARRLDRRRPRLGAARLALLRALRRVGQVSESHSISAGLDYPGVGPEHALLAESGRAEYVRVSDDEALESLPPPVPQRGHHPGARVVARPVRRRAAGARARAGRRRAGLPLGPRRQGHRHRARPERRVKLRTPALAIYLMAGEDCPSRPRRPSRPGATAIEVGIPFSDPLADGPTIQRAAEAALTAGMTPPRCLEALAAARARLGGELPLIPMTYAAIVERYGVARFCADAAGAGATGLIVADVPPDDGDELSGGERAQRHRSRAAHGADERGRAARDGLPGQPRLHLRGVGDRHDRVRARSSTWSGCAACSRGCERTPEDCRCCAASASRAPSRCATCAPRAPTA